MSQILTIDSPGTQTWVAENQAEIEESRAQFPGCTITKHPELDPPRIYFTIHTTVGQILSKPYYIEDPLDYVENYVDEDDYPHADQQAANIVLALHRAQLRQLSEAEMRNELHKRGAHGVDEPGSAPLKDQLLAARCRQFIHLVSIS